MSEAELAEVTAETSEIEVTEDATQEESSEAGESTENDSTSEQDAEQAELKQELEQRIKQLKLKVDGQELEEELPFEVTPEQAEWLQKELQLARAAQKRMQESAELRKKDALKDQEIAGFMEALKAEPFKVLESMGIDTKNLSEQRLQEEIKKMEMTEEEREILELKQKLKEHQEKEEAAKKQAELEKQERLRDQYAGEYERDLMEAIDLSGLPKNAELIERLAQYMVSATKLGINLSFKDLIPMVQESIHNDIAKMAKSMKAEQLMEFLGEEITQQIVKRKSPAKKQPPVTPKDVQDTAQVKVKDDPFGKKFKTKQMRSFFDSI